MYYPIDEALAKRAHTLNSMRDYIPNSETDEYRRCVDAAAAIAEAQKRKVSVYYHEKIDAALDRYSRRLAEWYNAYNRNRASCPSILVSGGSNFPVAKKHKQNEREHVLFAQYDDIKRIPEEIKSIGTGPIDFADPHAREMLVERLEGLKKDQAFYKKINAWYRKKGTCIGCPDVPEKVAAGVQKAFEQVRAQCPFHDVPFPAYELSSIRDKVKRAGERLEQYDKLHAMKAEQKEYDGFFIVQNTDINRLQIVFDGKPELEVREALKANGFRWSPKNEAWQRQLTDNAMIAARRALNLEA